MLFISCHEIICPDKLSSRLLCKIQQNNTPKRDIDPKSCAHGKQKYSNRTTFSKTWLVFNLGVRGIIGIPINRDAVWKRYVSRYGLVVSVHSGIFVSFRKSK